MAPWCVRIGYAIMVVAILLISPLADVLPVNAASWLADLIRWRPHPSSFRVVPVADGGLENASVVFFLIGLAVVVVGMTMRRSRR